MVHETTTKDVGESPTQMIPGTTISRICGQRDAAIEMMNDAADLLTRGHLLAKEARDMAASASGGTSFSLVDRSKDSSYKRLFESFDAASSQLVFTHHTDASVWLHLLHATGMQHLMDQTERDKFFHQLSSEVPPVNEDNILATLESLHCDAELIFKRGLARAFSDLDSRFKSHDAFMLKSRIILTRVFDGYGSWSYRSATISDVERVLAVLDGKKPNPGALEAEIRNSRAGKWGPCQGVCETVYLRIKTYKNGNAHLWFTRPDLVTKANLMLAEFYGEVLPDAVGKDHESFRTSGVPAKNLSFYPTPSAVVSKLIARMYVKKEARVLEPSAGTGHIARGLLKEGYVVDAIEIDDTRVEALTRIPDLRVLPGNFLRMQASPVYDAVVMNPPFYGTHYMEHVVHAYDWLAPGGILLAVLPATAEIGTTKKHEKFRKWADTRSRGNGADLYDLPQESFVSSGTRINTVILKLRKPTQ